MDKQRIVARNKAIVKAGVRIGLLILLLIIVLVGQKIWNIYQQVRIIEEETNAIETYIAPAPNIDKLPEIATKIHKLRIDLDSLEMEMEPYFGLTAQLGGLPKYGGTISQTKQIFSLTQNLVTAADEALTAITPAIETASANDKPLDVMELLNQLQSASPQLSNAQISLAQAEEARKQINVEILVPQVKKIITARIDPLFRTIAASFPAEDALSMVRIAPKLLGGTSTGPQTYLILLQNEDELRPTGGYLTAAGLAVVSNGKLISLKIESSELVDDLNKPYPIPPWQFKEFMNIDMFLFRDSNWFTNFPTTASWAKYFYAYPGASPANGVIALDMHVIVRLLETLGPIQVDNVSYPITSENVLEYMRSAEKSRPQGTIGTWDRKQFISDLAKPLLEKTLGARGQAWTKLLPVLIELLDERHILLQFDDAEATALLEHRNWDGSVHIPPNSDYLMIVDANMGYNKSNAVMETSFDYRVNLTTLARPKSFLLVQQINHSTMIVPCEPFFTVRYPTQRTVPGNTPEPYYNMDECHWGYLRVYTPEETKLIYANPREIPAESTMLGNTIPARTDNLGNEDIADAQVFGMMILTPTHQSTTTELEYSLPADIITKDNAANSWSYQLKVQKQPGTIAESFTLTLQLPTNAKIMNANVPFVENNGTWTAQLDLRRDLMVEVHFGAK